jgi:TonB family protein
LPLRFVCCFVEPVVPRICCRKRCSQMLRFWPCIALFALAGSCAATVTIDVPQQRQSAFIEREHRVWRNLRRRAEFSEVPHISARSRCEDSEPPQALATPDPMTVPFGLEQKVKVSFIIGADGRVHSPLILQSAGTVGDRNVLRTVRTWRYRPATCNGVPTESEGKIEFSRR